MSTPSQSYFISAGEPSGDLLAADLVKHLKQLWPEGQAHGITGPQMQAAGVVCAAEIQQLTVMGFGEVLAHLTPITQLEQSILTYCRRLRPAFIVLVDYPGFHMHLGAELRRLGFTVYQYVAPQLWAWKENRVKKLRQAADHVFGIMPFEVEFFHKHQVAFNYIGTPQVDRAAALPTQPLSFGYDATQKVVGFFPGSRSSELRRIAPQMFAIINAMYQSHPELHFAISLAPSIPLEEFKEVASTHSDFKLAQKPKHHDPVPCYALSSYAQLVCGQSLALMQRCNTALVTSGTATLECALSKTPMAVIYITSTLTYAIAKRVVKLPAISLVNLVAGKAIVKEFIQDFPAQAAAEHLSQLTFDPKLRQAAEQDLANLRMRLKSSPGLHTAQKILEFQTPDK